MSAPLIIRDQRDRPDQQEIVLMLADFSFTPPEQIFAELKKGGRCPRWRPDGADPPSGCRATENEGNGSAGGAMPAGMAMGARRQAGPERRHL